LSDGDANVRGYFDGSGNLNIASLTASKLVFTDASKFLTSTGTVGIAQGGTGQTTASAAFNALSPITTTGDLIIGNGTNSTTRLGIGTNGYVLTSNGTTASWQASTGGVTSFQTSLSGLTPSSSTTGAVTLAGTLGATSGGTAQSTYTTGDILYASASNTLSKLTIGTNGYVLTVAGGKPAWSASSGGGGCKAWLRYTGSTATINGSFNVSSVTVNGTGDYTLNFTTALADANYATVVTSMDSAGGTYIGKVVGSNSVTGPTTYSTTQVRVGQGNGSAGNTGYMGVIVCGN
jgi:hypothetical protein